MNNRRIIRNIGISFAMKPLNVFLSFVYIPLVLDYLGEIKYGIWVVILNVISWINYFDIGIGNGLRNKLTEALATNDLEKAEKYVSTSYVITMAISTLFCLTISALWEGFRLTELFNLSAPDENIDYVIILSIFFVCLNFMMSLSKTMAYAIQQPSLISVVSVIGQVFQICAVLIISKFYVRNLWVIALVYGIITLTESVLIYIYIISKYNYLKPRLIMVDRRCVKPLLTLGVGFFVMQICTLILNTTDNLLISGLFGSAEVTPYNVVYRAFYMIVQLHAIIILPIWSAYTEAATKRDIGWIKHTIKRINCITAVFAIVAVVGMNIFEPLASIWLGRKLIYGRPLIILVSIYMIAQMIGNNYSSFLCGVGKISVSAIIAGIGAVLNIPLSIFFASYCGMRLSGIILGSLIVMMMNVVVLPIVSHHWLLRKESEWN